ncbi:MAG: hypothetical protein IMZ62_16670 [Chloroflexi bacterium]|nr:hypothetical protein [Chloroflexota bacterium]
MKVQATGLDGNTRDIKLAYSDALPVAPIGPKYLEWVRKGYIFTARATAAQALIIFSTATNAPTLWNPSDSGKVVVPLRINLSPVAVASAVHTGILAGFKSGCGSQPATGAALPTFTNKAPTCNCPGLGKTAKTKYSDAVVTFTAIPATLMDLGAYQAAAGLPVPGSIEFDGTVLLAPGDTMSILAQAASVNTYWLSVIFAEVPLEELAIG